MSTSITSVTSTQSKLQVNGTDSLTFDSAGNIGINAINSGYLYGNRVINGAMEIDQQNSGASFNNIIGYAYGPDMFGLGGTAVSKLTGQQVVDAPAGLKNSFKVSVATQYSPAATDKFTLSFAIEGKDVIDFQLGTATAATFTLSKWIKSSIAGTYTVQIRNSAGTRSYIGTMSVTTSWSQVKLTIAGDTTGTWLTDNGMGMFISIDLGSGTNFNGTANTWQAGDFTRTSSSVTFVNQAAGATLNITGVDCRLGSSAPTYFERRPNELQLCQRYYEFGSLYGVSYAASSTAVQRSTAYFKVTKRIANPTMTYVYLGGISQTATTSQISYDYLVVGWPSFTGAGQEVVNSYAASARLF